MRTAVAVPWFVLEITGSAAKMGFATAAVGVGTALAALSGSLVDRLGFRRARAIVPCP